MKRAVRPFLLPALALTLWVVAPLVTGSRTLFLRDVFNTHLPMRIWLGQALRAGELPMTDPLRAGGQGLLGNPNAVPLYPDNLLLLVASDLWQLNAHFWIHWWIAMAAMYALGRCMKLGREASAGAAVLYGFSGYFLSQLNLYNAVAGAALAPALAAALLASAEKQRRRLALPLLGALWALELLAGDPILAALALLAALLFAGGERRTLPWRAIALALVGGTLLTAPQWIETLRLLPGSFRGFWGMHSAAAGSPDPRGLLDLLLPLFFGPFDRHEFWGGVVFGGPLPLYGSLAPGLVALALVAAGLGRTGAHRRWLTAALLCGAALAYSRGFLIDRLAALPGADLFRFPVKFALVATLAACLAAGRGLELLLAGDEAARRGFGRAMAVLLALEGALLALLLWPESWPGRAFRALFAGSLPDPVFEIARTGWVAGASGQLLWALAVLGAGVVWLRRRPRAAAAFLVALHAAVQLLALRSLVATEDARRYAAPPPLLAAIPADAVTTNGCFGALFCRQELLAEGAPDRRILWSARRAYDELYSFSLLAAGRRNELHLSPEGLDAFPVAATMHAIRTVDDARRLRILAAMGVDRVIVDRPLDAATADRATLVSTGVGSSGARVYALLGTLPDAVLVGRAWRAPHLNEALARVVAADFDARRETVISGQGPPLDGPPGAVDVDRWRADEIALTAESAAGGVVVLRRAWLSIWRAEVGGAEAPVRIANLNRLAVEVPAGRHAVRFFVSRRPFALALALAGMGALMLVALARRPSGSAAAGAVP